MTDVILGALLLISVAVILVGGTVWAMGWRVALAAWTFAVALTAVMCAGVYLITGSLS